MSRIDSKEVNALCSILRKQGPVSRRMVGNNILISVKTKSASIPVPTYWVNVLDHVHRVTGHLCIGAMVANLAELVGPRFIARETTFVPAKKIVTPRLIRPRQISTLNPERNLNAKQTEMRQRFAKQVGVAL